MRRKPLLRALAIVAGGVLLLTLGGQWLAHRPPAWYTRASRPQPDENLLANSALDKYLHLPDMVTSARARDLRLNHPPVAPDDVQPVEPSTISFTQDELNALVRQWSIPYRGLYEASVRDPVVALESGHIILAGRLAEMNTILSLTFAPTLDGQGMLHLDLVAIHAGSLPVPEALLAGQRGRLKRFLESRLAAWQRGAVIDVNGSANHDAVAAVMAKLILRTLRHQGAPAVLFVRDLPDPGHGLPVRLTRVLVEDERLTLTVQSIDSADRAALINQIQGPLDFAEAAGN